MIFDKVGADDEAVVGGPKVHLLLNAHERIDAYGLLGRPTCEDEIR